jgi:hypothetical protein
VILEAVITLFAGIISTLVGALPTMAAWDPGIGGIATVVGMVKGLDAYFPITETIACFGVVVLVVKGEMAFEAVMWVVRRIRG